MSICRRRLVIVAVTAGGILFGSGICLLCRQPSKITAENAAKIHEGMTLAAAETILGGPPRDESTGPTVALPELPFESVGTPHSGPAPPMPSDVAAARWHSDTIRICVVTDGDGRVLYVASEAVRPQYEGPLGRVREWLVRVGLL